MQKIKIFQSLGNVAALEKEIGEWLAQNPAIVIHHTTLSTPSEGKAGVRDTLLIVFIYSDSPRKSK